MVRGFSCAWSSAGGYTAEEGELRCPGPFLLFYSFPRGCSRRISSPWPCRRRRPAEANADAGPQGTEIDARIQPGKALAADALEPVVGWLGDQPRERSPHRALIVEQAGNRGLCGHGGWRLRIRRQRKRPEAGGERRSEEGHGDGGICRRSAPEPGLRGRLLRQMP